MKTAANAAITTQPGGTASKTNQVAQKPVKITAATALLIHYLEKISQNKLPRGENYHANPYEKNRKRGSFKERPVYIYIKSKPRVTG